MTTYKIYDNGGKTLDRYTIVFNDENDDEAEYIYYIGASEDSTGFWQHGEAKVSEFSTGKDKLVDITQMTPEFQLKLLQEFQA
jgi:hypothetical protein